MTTPNPTRRTPLPARLGLLALLLAAAGMLTTTAWTRDTVQWVGFTCDDGDRFAVEYLADHVRLRHGTGIFALTAENTQPDSAYWTYSDGQLVLIEHEDHVILKRSAVGMRHECIAEVASST